MEPCRKWTDCVKQCLWAYASGQGAGRDTKSPQDLYASCLASCKQHQCLLPFPNQLATDILRACMHACVHKHGHVYAGRAACPLQHGSSNLLQQIAREHWLLQRMACKHCLPQHMACKQWLLGALVVGPQQKLHAAASPRPCASTSVTQCGISLWCTCPYHTPIKLLTSTVWGRCSFH